MNHRLVACVAIGLIVVGWLFWSNIKNQSEGHFLQCKSTKIALPDGYIIDAQIANTATSRAKGLSGRANLGLNQGMLFIFPKPDIYSFWMKNTKIALDIIWLNNNKVVEFVTLEAHVGDNIESHTPLSKANAVLEVNKGIAKNHQVEVGSLIRWNDCTS